MKMKFCLKDYLGPYFISLDDIPSGVTQEDFLRNLKHHLMSFKSFGLAVSIMNGQIESDV